MRGSTATDLKPARATEEPATGATTRVSMAASRIGGLSSDHRCATTSPFYAAPPNHRAALVVGPLVGRAAGPTFRGREATMHRHNVLRALIALAFVGVSRAFGQTSELDYTDYCTTGALIACASVDISVAPIATAPPGEEEYALAVAVQNLQGTDPTDNTGGYGISGVFFKLNVADQTGTSGNAELQQDPNPIVTVEVVGEEGGYLTGTWFNPLFENVPGGCDTDCYVSFDNERGAFPGPNLVAGCDSVPLNGPNPPFLYTIGSWSTCPKDLGDDWVTFTDDVIIVNALADAPPLTASDISDVEWNEAVPGGGSYLGYGSVPGSNSLS